MHCLGSCFGFCKFPISSWKSGFELSECISSPLGLSQKSKWFTEPFTLSGFISSLFCGNIGILQCLCLAGSSGHPMHPLSQLRLLEPSLTPTTPLPSAKGCKISATTSFACALSNSLARLYLPGVWRQHLDQGLDWALLAWQCGRSQKAKRNLEPSWEGRLPLVSPLPSRAFHPPCILQQLIHKSGASPKRLRCSGCSPSRAEMEVSLLLCQHRAAKILIFS